MALDVAHGQNDESLPPPKADQLVAIIDRIRQAADRLDAEKLDEKKLTALSNDVQRLIDVAKAQEKIRKHVAACRAQVEDWETQHAEIIAEATNTALLARLKNQIEGNEMDQEDVGVALGLIQSWFHCDAIFQEKNGKLDQARGDQDFELVGSLASNLVSLQTELARFEAKLDEFLTEPCPDSPTSDDPVANFDETSESEMVGADDPPVEPRVAEKSKGKTDDATRFDKKSDLRIQDAIAKSIEHGRLGLAYHLSLEEPDALPNANAIKLAACSHIIDEHTRVTGKLSEIARMLLEEAQKVAEEEKIVDPESWRCHVLFTTCAALLPALSAPDGLVAQQLLAFLDRWLKDTPALRELVKTAAGVKSVHLSIVRTLLQEEDSREKWQEKSKKLHNETKSWFHDEEKAKMNFRPAAMVWREIIQEQHSLGYIFRLEKPENVAIEKIKKISEHWKLKPHADKKIDEIDRKIRSSRLKNKIEGSARSNLYNKIKRALALYDRWLELFEERPEKIRAFQRKHVEALRKTVDNNFSQALTEIGKISVRKGAEKLLRRYAKLFDSVNCGNAYASSYPVNLNVLLNGDLLADPRMQFGRIVFDDDTGQLVDIDRLNNSSVDSLLNLVEKLPDLGLGVAAEERARREDFSGAEAAVDVAERTGRTGQINDVCEDRSRDVIACQRERSKRKLKKKIEEVNKQVDRAYAVGLITLQKYEYYCDLIAQDDSLNIGVMFDPRTKSDDIEMISDEIADHEKEWRTELHDRLKKAKDKSNLSQENEGRIKSAIKSGRFQVATDFIERIEDKLSLPPAKTVNRHFDKFFPNFVAKYTKLCEEEGYGLGCIRDRISCHGSDELIPDLPKDASVLLNTWIALCDARTTTSDRLKNLMRTLGFTQAEVLEDREKKNTRTGESVFKLRTGLRVIRGSPAVVQLPDFGSGAERTDGYRLFAVRNRSDADSICRETQKIESDDTKTPNLVVLLGILDVEERRRLASILRSGQYHPTIVLDESLVAFLATIRLRDRQNAFFDCTLAFTSSQPYVSVVGKKLPPEMFFGREEEREKILAMSGDLTHLVYGGRRLGKTVLLSDIEHQYRNNSKKLVLRFSLQSTGIGEGSKPTEAIWDLFAKKLWESQFKIVDTSTVRHETVANNVKQWLAGEEGRRILLLVDEADNFLKEECNRKQQKYKVINQIKNLMQDTNLRFKVVFAGLHNVQRTAYDYNTPFAHMGDAVCIGPMLPENHGKNEIEKLIRDPLEALGYRISSDSVIRIAAETNYHPALVQKVCKQLLEEHPDDAVEPPYQIDQRWVDRVFSDKETRDGIQDIFRWTIGLDPKYRFLTYLIAKMSFSSDDGRPKAMPVQDVRDKALKEWPRGFKHDAKYSTFEALLEEMVGLGILRETTSNKYAIRTRNLRMLLGDDSVIQVELDGFKSKDAPPIFDSTQLRRDLSSKELLSSFTARQEEKLCRPRYAVSLIFGTSLGGIDRIYDSFEKMAADRKDVFVEKALPTALHKRARGIHFVLVDMRSAWNVKELLSALQFVKNHSWSGRIIRPVVFCGPNGAWEALDLDLNEDETMSNLLKTVELHQIWLQPCGRNFARAWLRTKNYNICEDLDNFKVTVDPLWLPVVERAARDTHLDLDKAIDITMGDDECQRYVGDVAEASECADAALRLWVIDVGAKSKLTIDLLSGLSEDQGDIEKISVEEAGKFFVWAERLGFVHKEYDEDDGDRDEYRLNKTYASGLERLFKR